MISDAAKVAFENGGARTEQATAVIVFEWTGGGIARNHQSFMIWYKAYLPLHVLKCMPALQEQVGVYEGKSNEK
jgi:hypothetical protein